MTSSEFLREFAESMPPAYRAAHDASAIAAHARVAAERGSRLANVGLCPPTTPGVTQLCVVADDRPGLLATISAALVLEGLDVIEAEAHTRKAGVPRPQAVDVFSVQRSQPAERELPITPADAERLRDVIVDLLKGKLDPRSLRRDALRGARTGRETLVRFLESEGGDLTTLEVETDDRSGLLLSLAHALFDQGVQIVESAVKTSDQRVFDRFQIVELDGRPISPSRRLEIQVAVLSAVEPTLG